ncbi:MAG: DUF1992 domain-containing protein [Caldilineaceae bacterium]|nr:DUF1992 domain-containing protein [Caldilineaceae bacterium]
MTEQNSSQQRARTSGATNKFIDPNTVKAKVHQYQDGKSESPSRADETADEKARVVPRSELEWNDLISNRIEEAMRNGAFDNLRNKGKPLPNLRNPHVPADQQMANDLLKNNGLAPQWISDRTSMLHAIELFRVKLAAIALAYQAELADATTPILRNAVRDRWVLQVERWQEEIHTLNQRINVINLQQPIARLEIFKLRLDDELKRVEMNRVL